MGLFGGLGQDIVEGIPHQVAGRPDPILSGSSTLASTLLEHGLADEVLLVVYPVPFPEGIRLDCSVGIGAAIGNSRAAWLEFLNTANLRGQIAQFSLFEDKVGWQVVKMCAFVGGAYNRTVFGIAMDMWHDDLEIVRRKPAFSQASDASEDNRIAATVN